MDFQERKRHSEYWQKRLEAKAVYSGVGKVWCPALSDWIVFNMKGFTHLVRKGKSLRPEKEQMRRFFLLRYAAQTLKDSKVKFTYKQEAAAGFWVFKKPYSDREIILVVRQIGTGQKHFFSVMDRLY